MMRDDERGGTAVVLLHGWGAPADDLEPLARALDRPRTRFFLPAGPLTEFGGGRAWWHLDLDDRSMYAANAEVPPGYQPHRPVIAAREVVQAQLRTIQERHAPDSIAIAGFSQGAMLALDVALAASPPVDRVAVLSGVLLADSIPAVRTARPSKPAVFVSHGRDDQVVPFHGGELAKEILESHGFAISWHPFDGGHEIPPAIVEELRVFLFER